MSAMLLPVHLRPYLGYLLPRCSRTLNWMPATSSSCINSVVRSKYFKVPAMNNKSIITQSTLSRDWTTHRHLQVPESQAQEICSRGHYLREKTQRWCLTHQGVRGRKVPTRQRVYRRIIGFRVFTLVLGNQCDRKIHRKICQKIRGPQEQDQELVWRSFSEGGKENENCLKQESVDYRSPNISCVPNIFDLFGNHFHRFRMLLVKESALIRSISGKFLCFVECVSFFASAIGFLPQPFLGS